MPYNDTPLPTEQKNNSQPRIRDNFTAIGTFAAVNHVALNVANAGKHSKLDIVADATHPLTAANELLLYNFANVMTSANELYIKKAGILGTPGIPMTAHGGTTKGWSYLPSGLLIKWSSVEVTTRNTRNLLTFDVGATIPAFTTLFAVFANQTFAAGTPDGDLNTALSVGEFTATSFKVFPRAVGLPGGANISFSYLAIGI